MDQDNTRQDNSQQQQQLDKAKDIPKQIEQKLSEKGFKDIKIVPGSYIVSAKDKDNKPIMMLIGPGQMTVLSGEPNGNGQDGANPPSIAQSPGSKGEIYQE
ncbi:MAG TPA: hypothetical protein VFB13_12035 [Reyranella sp.]|nr:hypothetical protein [Reyranella sp.]